MCSIACLSRNVQGGITGLAPMKTCPLGVLSRLLKE
jgi:hypothetical protein